MSSRPSKPDNVHSTPSDERSPNGRRGRLAARADHPAVHALVGLALGLAITWPAWSGDALLNLDLVVFDRDHVPVGVWGIGPELPRQAPALTILALAGTQGGAVTLTAMLMTACVAGAFVGVVRLSRPAPIGARLAVAALFALGPWLVTRLAVGHLGLALTAATLPWVLPTLLRPAVSLPRTFVAALALGLTGYAGGTLCLVVVVAGVIGLAARQVVSSLAVALVAQLPWLAPALAVTWWGSGRGSSAANFATDVDGLGDLGRVLLGYGFWQRGNEIGLASAVIPIAGVALFGLALLGARDLPRGWGRRAGALAAVAVVVAVVQSFPVVDSVYVAFADTLPGAVFRESQRVLVLYLVWLAPSAAHGLGRIRASAPAVGTAASVGVAALALALVMPEIGGVGGRLQAVELPPAWSDARSEVAADPGTVLALPWSRYVDVAAADGRRTFHPIQDLVGGDVLDSSDPGFSDGRREASDPREEVIEAALDQLERGVPLSSTLRSSRVRWVALVAGAQDERWVGLRSDAGLELLVDDPTLQLFRVALPNESTSSVARATTIAPVVGFGREVDGWAAPYGRGWLTGLRSASGSADGSISFEASASTVWYWPSVPVIGAYAGTVLALAVALRSLLVHRGPAR
jgi:hypothetical protein